MSKDIWYMVFRVYPLDEIPDPELSCVFYGWTRSKAIAKAFLRQRAKSKYRIRRLDIEELQDLAQPLFDDSEEQVMIDFVKLRSAKSHEEVFILTTARELMMSEIRIQKMLNEASSLKTVDADITECVYILSNLKEKYADALYNIGFRPPEMESMYPSEDGFTVLDETSEAIEYEYRNHSKSNKGLDIFQTSSDDLFSKSVYSLENFIRVMKDDL